MCMRWINVVMLNEDGGEGGFVSEVCSQTNQKRPASHKITRQVVAL